MLHNAAYHFLPDSILFPLHPLAVLDELGGVAGEAPPHEARLGPRLLRGGVEQQPAHTVLAAIATQSKVG